MNVETADEMYKAVMANAKKQDIIIMSAAVADYTPVSPAKEKIKKKENELSLPLRSTPDILKSLGEKKTKKQILVGFALETTNELDHAKDKLKKKNLDLIVMNSTKDKGAAFGVDTNIVTLIDAKGTITKFPKMPKFDVAVEILDKIVETFHH